MCQFFTAGGFRWLAEKEINKINLATYKEDSKKGLILDVDLGYPEELHKNQNRLSLAPEKNKGNKRNAIPLLRII